MRLPSCLIVAALLASGCVSGQPTPQMASAAASLAWSVETDAGQVLGSGTAFGPGRVLTNAHVVAAANGARIIVRRESEALPVRAVRTAVAADLALLTVPGVGHPSARPDMASSVQGGILAVATRGSSGPRVSFGAAGDTRTAERFGPGLHAARLTVARGYSGAPVVDAAGRLVGIVMAGVVAGWPEAQRLAAAQAADQASEHLTLLISTEAISQAFPHPL